jgi:ABC-type Na+ efflux pump permease subunit
MEWAALVTWVLTAGGGFFLLGLWLKNGGMRQADAPDTRIRTGRILSHFALAAIGLVLWIVYVATDSEALAWIAFVLLALVALLGFAMLAIWLGQRRRRAAAMSAGGNPEGAAEQSFPTPVVVLHGVLAATTLVLVLLTAAGVGGS